MASFNKVILIGNMTADPELKQTTSGLSVCSFSIAVNRRFAKEGEQNVDFINIVSWRNQAEFVTRYFKKGMPILICGQIQTRSWTDNTGNKRFATDVVADEVAFVGNAKESNAGQKNEPSTNAPSSNAPYMPEAYMGQASSNFEEIPSDESLPF